MSVRLRVRVMQSNKCGGVRTRVCHRVRPVRPGADHGARAHLHLFYRRRPSELASLRLAGCTARNRKEVSNTELLCIRAS